MYKQFKHLAYCFFDIKQLSGENPGLTVSPKDIPGIEPSITVDGYSIKWLDYNTFDFSTKTVSATGLKVTVADAKGFAVNDTVYIKKAINASGALVGVDVDATVIAVDPAANTIDLDGSALYVNGAKVSSLTGVVADQEVVRGFWKRNDNDEIVRPASAYNYVEFQSYVQHFSRRITFTKAELNKEYKYEGEAKNEATKRLNYNIGVMFQEINKAIYKGKNVAPGA